ncbi:MAG: zf-TFIIB domain-containing protein, partial [Candidatus Omnitrophica bacterium]|nr:zf-TFIIB domain-containing protein [Candidatus Omnitrophota bacterium]
CMKKMEKILYENKNIILIDKCSLNHGLWFDQGELKKIVEIVNLDKNNKITLLLDDIFGMKNREVES